MFTNQEKNDMAKLLGNIVQAKENFCTYIRENGYGCKSCPLGVEDKCSPLDLPEFDFDEQQWEEEIYDSRIYVGKKEK